MKVALKGKKYETNGNPPNISDHAPKFSLKDLNEQNVNLDDLLGEVILISTFPDIKTSTCSKQTSRFNELAETLNDVKILSISTNTADQQKDWCGSKEIHTVMLRDEDRSFGKDYGIYIEEMDKLARSIFVLNRDGQIVHREIVEEMSEEPNYDEAIASARHEESEL